LLLVLKAEGEREERGGGERERESECVSETDRE